MEIYRFANPATVCDVAQAMCVILLRRWREDDIYIAFFQQDEPSGKGRGTGFGERVSTGSLYIAEAANTERPR